MKVEMKCQENFLKYVEMLIYFLFLSVGFTSNLEIYYILTYVLLKKIMKKYFRGEFYWPQDRNDMSWNIFEHNAYILLSDGVTSILKRKKTQY